jgi:hypothetical protein
MVQLGSVWTAGRSRRCIASFVMLVGAIALATAGTVSSAGASTASVTDAVHDNGPGFDPHGDIVQVSVTTDTPSVVLELSVAAFDDPSTSPNWSNGATAVGWNVDTNGDGTADYVVTFTNGGFGPYIVVVAQPSRAVVCGGDPSWDASTAAYLATLDPSCFGNAQAIAVAGWSQYFDASWNGSFDETAYTDPVNLPSTTTTSTPTTSASTTSTSTTSTSTTTTTLAPTTTTTVPESTTTTVAAAPTTTTTVDPTTTTAPATTTTTTVVSAPCKPGYGWGDDNHVHCDRPLTQDPRRGGKK